MPNKQNFETSQARPQGTSPTALYPMCTLMLAFPQTSELTFSLQQRRRLIKLCNPAPFQYQNAVEIHNRTQSMRHRDDGMGPKLCPQDILDKGFGFGVNTVQKLVR